MYTENLDIEIIDFMEHLDFILSDKFIIKWKYRFSSKFMRSFQLKLYQSLSQNKPLKRKSLFNYLTKKCKYSSEQVKNFFSSIEVELLYPAII